jgi:hypothetical protein
MVLADAFDDLFDIHGCAECGEVMIAGAANS